MEFLTRREPDSMTPLLEEMERRMADWRWPMGLELERVTPPIELSESDDEVVLRAQVPGMKKDDLEIEVLDGSVNIRGEAKEKKEEKKKGYYRSEFRYGGFARTVALPSGVDVSRAEAKLDAGVLELRIPKTDEARNRMKKIAIR